MSASSDSEVVAARARHPLMTVLALLLLVLGMSLAGLGAWLFILGGSLYYVLAGLGLLTSGALLWRNLRSGVLVFAAVFIGTVAWTWWESGGSYWGWVPRLGLITALAAGLALLAPTLQRPPAKRTAWMAAGALALLFVAGCTLAFVPHGVTRVLPGFPQPLVATGLAPTDERPLQAADRPAEGDWPAWGRSNAGTRFSPAHQITTENVGTLQPAWRYRTDDLPQQRWGAETTPLKVDDTVYLCTARNQMIALDAATGAQRWRFDPKVKDAAIVDTATCRGVAYYQTPEEPSLDPLLSDVAADLALPSLPTASSARRRACATRIIEGTLDGRLIAVDAVTGMACRGFGNNGQVDITVGMGEVTSGSVAITSPPVIVRGVIVSGHEARDVQGRGAPSGVIQAFDVLSGKLRWAWDMERPDRSGAPPPGQAYTRGTPTLAAVPSSDDRLGLVYLSLGRAAPLAAGTAASDGRAHYASALVALDVATGKPVWSFQTVRDDAWNYGPGSQATLLEYPTPAGKVPAILLPTRQGDLYVLDRRTGALLSPVETRDAPRGGDEPEPRARTQVSSLFHSLRRDALTERDMWGLTPIDQLVCRIQFRLARYDGPYTPPSSDRHFIEYPGPQGGADWGGVSIDPRRAVIVANYNDLPGYNRLLPAGHTDAQGWLSSGPLAADRAGANGAADAAQSRAPAMQVNTGWRLPFTGLWCKQPPYGGIRAIDLRSGRTLWDRPFGSARGSGPFGLRSGLPMEIGTLNQGGSVITASGLVFIAAATDDLLRAIDLETGTELWHAKLPAGGQATPMIYSHEGRDYVVIMAGGHHGMGTPAGDHVIAYALPAP